MKITSMTHRQDSVLKYKTKQKIKYALINNSTKIIMFILMAGFAYIILYPFIFKVLASFMSKEDFYDVMVDLVPRNWTFDTYKDILKTPGFLEGMKNTVLYALIVAVCATASASLVGYGLARFKFPGVKILTGLVILTMMIPIQTISLPLFSTFRFFDVFGIIGSIKGEGLELTNTVWPLVILSSTSLGFRAGIYVILMRQYYSGIPKELIEAASVDGSGPFRTFFMIILPMAKSMLIVIFSLSMAWQWTDTFYTGLLMGGTKLAQNSVLIMASSSISDRDMYYNFVKANAAAILMILPLVVFYIFLQKKIIQGVETSGLVG